MRKPWQDLMKSVSGYVQSARVPIRPRASPYLKPTLSSTLTGTEREPLLTPARTSDLNKGTLRRNTKELKKQKLVEQAVKDGLFPQGVAGEAIAGTLKRKDLKAIIRRQTEPALSPGRPTFDPEDEIIDEVTPAADEGGQNL